jgi:beta-glucanase (GH16 family)
MPATEPVGWTRVYAAGGWTERTLARDFTAYPSPWRDTSRIGRYVGLADVTVPAGQITIRLHSDAQGPRSTALQPHSAAPQRYGRYSVRARMTSNGGGFRTAWTLWPENGRYPAGGSIAWPDGDITGAPSAFVHWASATGGKDSFTQPVQNSGWHTWTIEWSPGKVVFLVDDRHVGTATRGIPSTPMHWVLQCETAPGGSRPPARTVATIQIAWITMASRT